METKSERFRNAFEALCILVQANQAGLLWGGPGTGKTYTIGALAAALKRHLETIIASIRQPEDFGGLPRLTDGGVQLLAPDWAHRLVKAINGILFLDEITTNVPATQAALLRVLAEKVVGDLPLPATTALVLAANPAEIAAGGWDLAAPLANRVCHIDWPCDEDTWIEGMMNGFALPAIPRVEDNWQELIPGFRGLIASFINKRRGLLYVPPKPGAADIRGWASPRSWTNLADSLAAASSAGVNESVISIIAGGWVGPGNANELATWLRELDLPDADDVLRDPSILTLPDKRADRLFAILSNVALAVRSNPTPERWQAAWSVLARVAEAKQADVAVISAHTLLAMKPSDPAYRLPVKELAPFAASIRAAKLSK